MRLYRPLLFFSLALPCVAQDVHVHVSSQSHGTTASTDGFPTIQMALDHAPEPGPAPGKNGRPARLFLHIAAGIYSERVIVTQNRPNTTLLGEGPDPSAVVITASQNAKSAGGTFFTETVRVDAPGFEADNLTFENSAGNTGQAVALANRSDRSILKHCRILGHQDTLFADFGRQYYLDDYIEGTVDFIFGNAAAVFDHSEIHELSPAYLTAQSRTSPRQTTGYVILHSRIAADHLSSRPERSAAEGPASLPSTKSLSSRPERSAVEGPASPSASAPHPEFFLGRPWRAYSRAVVIETELPSTLSPQGWSKWKGNNNDATAFYAEFHNTGQGAVIAQRAAWTHQLTPAEMRTYLPENFLRGSDNWNPQAEAASLP